MTFPEQTVMTITNRDFARGYARWFGSFGAQFLSKVDEFAQGAKLCGMMATPSRGFLVVCLLNEEHVERDQPCGFDRDFDIEPDALAPPLSSVGLTNTPGGMGLV